MRTLVLTLALLVPLVSSAQAPAEAKRFLETQNAEVLRLLGRNASPDRDRALTEKLGRVLDYQALSERALANHWAGLSAEQQSQFSSLLRQLVEASYRSNLERTLSFAVTYGDSQANAGEVLVSSVGRDRNNRRAPEVAIDYRVRHHNGEWRIVDVTVDHGMSMVENYRRQFDRILRRDGFEALIQRMQRRLNETTAH